MEKKEITEGKIYSPFGMVTKRAKKMKSPITGAL